MTLNAKSTDSDDTLDRFAALDLDDSAASCGAQGYGGCECVRRVGHAGAHESVEGSWEALTPAPVVALTPAPTLSEVVQATQAPAVTPSTRSFLSPEARQRLRQQTGTPEPVGAQVAQAAQIAQVAQAAEVSQRKQDQKDMLGADKGLLAVDAHSQVTGSVTYWQLSGGLSVETLNTALSSAGLSSAWLVSGASQDVALTRACKAQQERSGNIRRFCTSHPDGGFLLVDEVKVSDGEDKRKHTLDYKKGVRVWLKSVEGSTEKQLVLTPPTDWKNDADKMAEVRELGAKIRAEYDTARAEFSAHDVSMWLVSAMYRLKAVPLRDRGGVYFVPRASLETLKQIKQALSAATSHNVFEIPAMQSTDLVVSVVDAIRREAQDEIVSVESDLQGDEGISKRLASGRIKRLDEVLSKVKSYETLLGAKLGDLCATLTALRARVVASVGTRANFIEV